MEMMKKILALLKNVNQLHFSGVPSGV